MSANGNTPNQSGARLAGFELLERISSGAMGVVYKARQISMDRIVAVKILPPELAKDRTFVERFFREARAAGRLNHPNIVSGLDVGEASGHYYFAMEYVEGETLGSLLKRQGPLAEARALEITAAITRGLVHAFQQGIVHRDIKPANIIIARDGTPKLLDLGTAAMRSSALASADAALGTPFYSSPEQARGQQQADARSDIYSLGATLYHMLTGNVPYDGPSIPAILARHISDPVPNPKAKNPRISDGAAALVMRMMAKQPEDRFQTPVALLAAIERVQKGQPATSSAAARAATPVGTAAVGISRPTYSRVARSRKKSPLGLIIVVIMVLGSLGGAGWLIYHRYYTVPASSEPVPTDTSGIKAQKLFEEAKAYAEQHPDDYSEAIRLFTQIIRTYPNTIYKDQAEVERSGIESRRDAAAGQALQEMLKKASDYMQDQDFRHALGVFNNIPRQIYTPQVKKAIDDYKGVISTKAKDALDAADAKAVQLWSAGKPEEALKALEHSQQYQLLDHRKYIDQRIAQIREAMAKNLPPAPIPFHKPEEYAGPRERRQFGSFDMPAEANVRLLYATAASAAYKAIAQRDHEKATQALEQAINNPDLAPAKGDLEIDRNVLQIASKTWNAIVEAIPRLKGQEIFVGGIRGTVVGLDGGSILYTSYGATLRAPVINLKSAEAAVVAEKGLAGSRAEVLGNVAVLLVAEGELAGAESKIQQMKAEALALDEPKGLVEHVRRTSEEIQVADAFNRLKSQFAEQDWPGAVQSLAALSRLENNPTAKAVSGQIAPWKAWAREAAYLLTFFKGLVTYPEPGVTQVSYDFSSDKQLRDFEQIGGAWHVKHGALFQNEEAGVGWIQSRGRWLDAVARCDAILLGGGGAIGLSASDLGGSQVALVVDGDRYSVRQGRLGGDIFSGEVKELASGTLAGQNPGSKVCLLAFVQDGKMRFVVNNLEVAHVDVPDFRLETLGIVCKGRCAVDNVSAEGTLLSGWIDAQMAKQEEERF